MEFDGGETGSERIKGNGVKFVKTTSVSTVELFVDIPEWLLAEVMIRLPVKLVFRCKLVSKQWLSIISDPSFTCMYVSRASLLPQSQIWTFIYSFMQPDGGMPKVLEDAYSHDLKGPCFLAIRCPPSMRHHNIVGVSNGLVLTQDKVTCYPIYNIYNPITKKSILLPPPAHRAMRSDRCSLVTRVENGVLLSCRVVCFDVCLESSTKLRFEVFVSEINEWKEFDVYTDQAIEILTWREMPSTLNGILHWVTSKHGIMAYDPYQNPDSLRFIALPHDVDPTYNHECTRIISFCDAHQGHLRYLEVSNTSMSPHGLSSFAVWILNDYSIGDWCLQHRINSSDIIYADILSDKDLFLKPRSFNPFDPETVYLEYDDIIVSYNFKTRKLESHGCVFISKKYWWWSFSFVIPPWPTSIGPSSFGVLP